MKEYFVSSINWISYENGGRKKVPPKGTRYCPMLQICHNTKIEDWSIDFICPDFEETDMIEFKFLVNDVPSGLLEKDEKYFIYEGNKLVAQIKILEIMSQ